MPKITVNGVSLAYEIHGESGPPVFFSTGVVPQISFSNTFAVRFSSFCRVLFLDRRNSGHSDVAIEEAPSLAHQYIDDLHYVLQSLNMFPAYIGGGSMGSVFSLLMAHRYPEDVKGLILHHTPTNDRERLRIPLDQAFFRLAEVAEKESMQVVIETSQKAYLEGKRILGWVAETIALNPNNRDRFLAMGSSVFAAITRSWGEWALSDRYPFASLTDEQVKRITVPAIVTHGFDALHPEHTAKRLCELLSDAEWADYSKRFSPERIKEMSGDSATNVEHYAIAYPFHEDFIQKIEAGER